MSNYRFTFPVTQYLHKFPKGDAPSGCSHIYRCQVAIQSLHHFCGGQMSTRLVAKAGCSEGIRADDGSTSTSHDSRYDWATLHSAINFDQLSIVTESDVTASDIEGPGRLIGHFLHAGGQIMQLLLDPDHLSSAGPAGHPSFPAPQNASNPLNNTLAETPGGTWWTDAYSRPLIDLDRLSFVTRSDSTISGNHEHGRTLDKMLGVGGRLIEKIVGCISTRAMGRGPEALMARALRKWARSPNVVKLVESRDGLHICDIDQRYGPLGEVFNAFPKNSAVRRLCQSVALLRVKMCDSCRARCVIHLVGSKNIESICSNLIRSLGSGRYLSLFKLPF
jgi:hypothetical protein